MAIGFHVPSKTPKGTRQACVPSEMLLTFDGGGGISLHEATHNAIALGSSGTGKTSSVILPALRSLLQAGYAGLIVDIKGNFTEQAKALAKHFGREADIVEFGTGSHARPVNILDGMDNRQVFEFLRILTVLPFTGHTGNLDWHLKGVRQAADCFELLRIMHTHCQEVTADLGTLDQLINDARLATAMFKFFSKNLSSPNNKGHRDLLRRVNNDEFHICSHKEGKSSSGNTSYAEQVTWRLGAVRDALSFIREAPGILRNFAAPGAPGIDLARLIYDDNKVVVLRFGVAAGSTGALLARHVLEAFYAATYQRGLALPEGQRVFLVGDEAQDFLDLKPYNKNNDNSFTAKAREFRVIQVLGTQSVASLGSRGAGAAQVNEYLNNFSNKVILFNDDPLTLNLAERFDPAFSFQDMKQGECLAIHFDAEKHRPVCSREGLQQAHDAVKNIVPHHHPEQHIRLMEQEQSVLEDTFKNMCQKASQDKQEARATTPEPSPKIQPVTGISRTVSAGGIFDELFDIKKEEPESSAPLEPEGFSKEPTELQRLVARYSSLFTKALPLGCEVPRGWLPTLERSMDMVKAMELTLHIRGFHCKNGRLYVLGEKAHMGLEALNSLLAVTCCTCPACGAHIIKTESLPEGEFPGEGVDERDFAFCADCLCKAGFVPEKSN